MWDAVNNTANLRQIYPYFLVPRVHFCYTVFGVSTQISRFFVRLGLFVVRGALATKAGLVRGAKFGTFFGKPIAKVLLSVLFVPLYRLTFGARRQVAHWYRPAKNKTMFLVTNRAMMHVAMVAVVGGTAALNIGMDSVRAESLDAFNKSLAYVLIAQEQSPLVEEFAEDTSMITRRDAARYLSNASLTPTLGAVTSEDARAGAASLAGGGGLAMPIIANASESVAPRDGVETYVVAEGDALSTIAAKFGISINTILWANNLTVLSTLRPGQSLTILPSSGVLYTVKSGDNLTKISTTYRAEAAEILAANKLPDASAIAAGQKLFLPGGSPPTPIAVSRPAAVRNIFVPAPTGSSSATISSGSTRMVWPATGHYIVRGLSWFHTGVDIDCTGRADGTSTDDNIAAADGIVLFSGWKTGYGYVVEITHGNGLMTRYGHNHALYVKTGQQVTAGTPIARCGSTGNSTGTHLHFEVIGPRGSRDYRNPLEYIR